MSKWECWRGSGVYISILCISVTSWSECFFLEIRWHMVFIVGLKSHRSRALESEVSLSSLKTEDAALGPSRPFTCSLISNVLDKAGKADLRALWNRVHSLTAESLKWDHTSLHQDDFTQFNRTLLTASDWDLNWDFSMITTFFFKLMGRNQWPGCRLFIIAKEKKKALKSLLNIHNLLINAGMYSCFLLNQGNLLNFNYVLYFLPLQLGVKYV